MRGGEKQIKFLKEWLNPKGERESRLLAELNKIIPVIESLDPQVFIRLCDDG